MRLDDVMVNVEVKLKLVLLDLHEKGVLVHAKSVHIFGQLPCSFDRSILPGQVIVKHYLVAAVSRVESLDGRVSLICCKLV